MTAAQTSPGVDAARVSTPGVELATVDDLSSLEALDPAGREIAVTQYLTAARDRLSYALQATGPAAVAAIKAEIVVAAEATKQLGLSKEIQADAMEMVRRSEYALGKAIRAGQEAGEIARRGDRGSAIAPYVRNVNGDEQAVRGEHRQTENTSKSRPSDFASTHELSGARGDGIYALADGVTEAEFDAALTDAKGEGDLSRANVVRKVKEVKSEGLTPVEKLRKIRELAPRGMTSDQIAREIGASEDYVRRTAKQCSIDIPADRVMRGTKRLDHTRFVTATVEQLDALASGLDVLDPGQVDWSDQADWVASLTDSMRALNRFVNTVRKGPND